MTIARIITGTRVSGSLRPGRRTGPPSLLRRLLALLLPGALAALCLADEGMWPVSELQKADLARRGVQLSAGEIFSPGGSGLVNAIVQLDGCTGSFVSADGLILTNHHCVFPFVQAASDKAHDYVSDGFRSGAREEEIPALGATARITESCRDVSGDVLSSVKEVTDPAARTRAIEKRMKEIVLETEAGRPGKRAEVAEMFPGQTYMLFLYTYLKDVRLVYVPPRSVGDYGGEEDNWVWPRHGGDFSFIRAYVAPDGQPAPYSPQNVPFRPEVFLKVAPEGVKEGDAVFLCGYPGRTYRHQGSAYLAYEEEVRMPDIAAWYEWQIDQMEKASAADPETALRLSNRIKGLANTSKNYRGKLAGMQRLGLVDAKRKAERELQSFIDNDNGLKASEGRLLEAIDAEYRTIRSRASRDLLLNYLYGSVIPLRLANLVLENAIERAKPDVERESAYMERNRDNLLRTIRLSLASAHRPTDSLFLKTLAARAAKLDPARRLAALDRLAGTVETPLEKWLQEAARSVFAGGDEGAIVKLLETPEADLRASGDPFLQLAVALYPDYIEKRDFEKALKGRLDPLNVRLMEVKRRFEGAAFIPDANSTLRFTSGRVKGYSPRDGVHYEPVTTVRGILEKDRQAEPFRLSGQMRRLILANDAGPFLAPGLGTVPVDILYDADTTGGNSGSPVMDAKGRLVALNFDRTWEATINDYVWSKDFSRSIGADIRFILWVTWKLGECRNLLEEMGVSLPRP